MGDPTRRAGESCGVAIAARLNERWHHQLEITAGRRKLAWKLVSFYQNAFLFYPGRIWPDLLDCKTRPWAGFCSNIIELFTQVLIYTTIITVYT